LNNLINKIGNLERDLSVVSRAVIDLQGETQITLSDPWSAFCPSIGTWSVGTFRGCRRILLKTIIETLVDKLGFTLEYPTEKQPQVIIKDKLTEESNASNPQTN